MSHIKLLPDDLINRIAAGEVVERPASILKEFLDNSLDAKSTNIIIEVLNGGKKLLRVSDNGLGMGEDDLLLSIERHATSKLDINSDLSRIETLGFRGEALASIAAVSKLTISTAKKDGEGRCLKIFGGKILSLEPIGRNQGTTIEAADLFYNVPARRKFLKTTPTENAHLLDTAQNYALSRLNLNLSYCQGTTEIFSVTEKQDILNKFYNILGSQAEEITPFSTENKDLKIHGYLGTSQNFSRSSNNLYLFISGRPVRDKLLSRAIRDGYGRLLPQGRWPLALIFIETDPSLVDVNVHPAKTEVRFRNPNLIFSTLSLAIKEAIYGTDAFQKPPSLLKTDHKTADFFPDFSKTLTNLSPLGEIKSRFEKTSSWEPVLGEPTLEDTNDEKFKEINKNIFEQKIIPPSENIKTSINKPLIPPWLNDEEKQFYNKPEKIPEDEPEIEFKSLKIIGQFKKSYIIAQKEDELFIIDQHAAHERIIWNRLKKEFQKKGLSSQNLLIPQTYDLSPHQFLMVEKNKENLEKLGFDVAHFGGQTIIVKAVPLALSGKDPWPVLLEILSMAQSRSKTIDGAKESKLDSPTINNWLYNIACQAALKAGQKLSPIEMEKLVDDLSSTPKGGYCPHGRPCIFSLNKIELDRKFGR